MNKQKSIHMLLNLLAIALLVLFDNITKSLAVEKLKNKEPFPIIKNVFELRYLENRGAAFGMFQNKQIVFIIVSVVFLIFIGYVLYKVPMNKKYYVFEFTLSMLAAGAIGNMIDRASQNYVVDFFYFRLINFPIFNVADIYVTISCVILGIILLFVFKEEDFNFISIKNKQSDE